LIAALPALLLITYPDLDPAITSALELLTTPRNHRGEHVGAEYAQLAE
jgi:hypothetical protein